MPELSLHLPAYPHLKHFSDPYVDFEGEQEDLARIAALAPASLSYMDLLTIFNSWLPAGSFEEMAPYVPRALDFIHREADDNENAAFQVLEHLIAWCYTEQVAMKRNPAFLRGMQQATMDLFHLWTSQTAWLTNASGEPELRHHTMVQTLLFHGDECAQIQHKTNQHFGRPPSPVIPWLASAHFLPQLTALDSVPHAAWTLQFCGIKTWFHRPKQLLPADTLRRAVDMVDDWLLSESASPADLAIWDPIVTRHREQLHYARLMP